MYENYGHVEDPPLRRKRVRYSSSAKACLFFIFLGLVSAPVLMYMAVNGIDINLPNFEKSEPKKEPSKARRRR